VEQKNSAPDSKPRPAELTSWKEIAEHLRVNVRTAQKWERERRLPVRRGPGPRSRVSANREALEAWRENVTEPTATHCYCWPLSNHLIAEIRFIGLGLRPEHLEVLREYLNLMRKALR
jgi:hypothetical protein